MQTTVVPQAINLGNPRIRYSQPKISTQSVVHIQEGTDQSFATSTQSIVTEQPIPVVVRNSVTQMSSTTTPVTKTYQNYRNVSPVPAVVHHQQVVAPIAQTVVQTHQNPGTFVGSRGYPNNRSSTTTIVG